MPKEIIGKRFGSWTVLDQAESDRKYNYYYNCRCDCGNTHIFRKDKLLDCSFSICNKCNGESILHKKSVSEFWDRNMNGDLVIEELSVKKNYLWKCPVGHIWKESILRLTKECPKCLELKYEDILNTYRNENFRFVINYLKAVAMNLDLEFCIQDEDYDILYAQLLIGDNVVVLYPKAHDSFNQSYHKSKVKFFSTKQKIQFKIKQLENWYEIKLDLNKNNDKKKIKKFVKKVLYSKK